MAHEELTDRARLVVDLAEAEAAMLGRAFLDTEHLLLGLIHEGENVGIKVLGALGIAPETVLSALADRGPEIAPAPSDKALSWTAGARKVLDQARRQAREHNARTGPEHILIGLLRVPSGVAAQVLTALGASLSRVSAQVIAEVPSYRRSAEVYEDYPPLQ